MNFKITNELINTIKPYTENSTIVVTFENKMSKIRNYKSDFVMIDENNNVGFEVLDNEIIVFYFTDHCHFEDYSLDLEDSDDNYIKRAKDFIINLFTYRIKYVKVFKGKKLTTEKYYFVSSDNIEEYIGGTWWGLYRFLNPFAKMIEKTDFYKFDKANGCFNKE